MRPDDVQRLILEAVTRTTLVPKLAPGAAIGVFRWDQLVASAGFGVAREGEPTTPDLDTVFRIASMTKSFTAATVLTLRERGLLRLDDPVVDHLPDLARGLVASADSPAITIRHLLTMTAGLPTDDPWGDHQQDLPLLDFAALQSQGLTYAWSPGTRFDYSNTGFALLGAVITAVSGKPYSHAVRELVLDHLHLDSTRFEASEYNSARLAQGYRRAPNDSPGSHGADNAGWLAVPPVGYGSFAPMGGLFSTVRDIARWGGWLSQAFPPRDDADPEQLLSRSGRRELQFPHAPRPDVVGQAYGMGLATITDPRWGLVITHGGGYPGFGSTMRWHPGTGLGVVVLANATYAPAGVLGRDLLDAVLSLHTDSAPGILNDPLMPASSPMQQATRTAQDRFSRALAAWQGTHDDWPGAVTSAGVSMDELFADNVASDQPWRERLNAWKSAVDDLTPLAPTPHQAVFDSPASVEWSLHAASAAASPEPGKAARVQVSILMSPEPTPRIQAVEVRREPRPAPPSVRIVAMLAEHADAVLAIYAEGMAQGTFETSVPSWEGFAAARLPDHRFVAVDQDGAVLGWVAASGVSDRCVYAGVIEHSVYVAATAQGRGVGRALLAALIDSSEAAGIWTIQSGVFPENAASLALHTQAGFRIVGRRERIGRREGVWRDVVLLERRSPQIS